jgi:hypothetical protein
MRSNPIRHPRPCLQCGKPFTGFPRQAFCGLPCSFWAKVNKTEGCWLWTASTSYDYGAFRYEKRLYKAHRLSWELSVGPVPSGLHVLHRCDTPRCVNPAHLFLGTHKDNCHDMAVKGRASKGSHRHNAKLTEEAARAALLIHSREVIGVCALARLFGVSHSTMGMLLRGQRWKHIERP